ncbi:unnamed protein product [Clonostachys rosea]|uniref:Heterokaryon incompatibility domain-containing protein n=1 Tax=Bionectria ochroleuca TaxID=29856 RepID=A0ABY6U9B7_BIOOC|nr:unnamed protein product [Clonostachys rosea]
MPPKTKYQYSSVEPRQIAGQPEPQAQFRLLTLLPGAFDDEISVTLTIADLDHNTPPRYEALSYVWGSEADPVPITLDHQYTLSITTNLDKVLRHLRHESEARVLWVDAVCINQDDLQERAQQVTLMGDVYRLAQQVVVWLGPEENDSSLALDYLDSLSRRIVVNWWQGTIAPASWVDTPWIKDLPISFSSMPAELVALMALFDRPWFERVWIRQEIFLARSAIVQCGHKDIPWEIFKNAVFCLAKKGVDYGDQEEKGPSFVERIRFINALGRIVPLKLRNVMESARVAQCKDSRDKVYGVLNMLDSNDSKMGILPDYNLPTEEIYKDLVLRSISGQNSLDMLRSAGLPKSARDLPTWVPDWTADREGRGVGNFLNAGGNLPPKWQLVDGTTLRVSGVVVARVAELFPVKTELTTYEDYRAGFREAYPSSQLTAQMYENSDDILEAYCRALCFDVFRDKMFPDTGGQSFRGAKATLEAIMEYEMDGSEYISDAEQDFQDSSHLAQKIVCVSDKGHIGMVPLTAQVGDLICVVPGCPSALVLRELPSSAGHYQLVGDAYMDGVMNGEAILGPLPDNWVAVWKREAAEAYNRPVFLLTTKLRFTTDDPRLDQFAIDRNSTENKTWEEVKAEFAKVTPEMLIKRGVQLVDLAIE